MPKLDFRITLKLFGRDYLVLIQQSCVWEAAADVLAGESNFVEQFAAGHERKDQKS
jgi:hypothetical protein